MMFNRLKVIGVWILLGILTPLWSGCPLKLANAIVTPTPLEYKGVGSTAFQISEEKGSTIPAKDIFGDATCQFIADLNKIVPKDYNLSLITGDVTTYFDMTYNTARNQVHFTQKLDIPANKKIKIEIPVDVIIQSPSTNPFNGFIVNIHASEESISTYTFTNKAIVVALSDSNNTIEGTTGGIAIENIIENDTINNKAITLGADINITSVTNNTPLVVDKTTGKVTVPAETKRGTYIESYTICEIYDPTNCSDANITVVVQGAINPPVIIKIDGNESSPSITSDATPTIDGTCEANLNVIIRIDGTEITPIESCDSNGTFSLIPEQNITDGEHNVTAVQNDNNESSEESNLKVLTVDSTAPGKPTVVITEDLNNDGNISRGNELNGTIDVHVTLDGNTEIGDILTLTHPSNREENVTVTQTMIDDGYDISYEDNSTMTMIIVKARVTDKVGNISEEDSDKGILMNDVEPDYDIDILLNRTTVENDVTPIDIIVRISELNDGVNSGDLIFSLTKNTHFAITFDSTLSTLNGEVLKNAEWEKISETETSYNFRYIGNGGKYPPKTRMRVGFKGVFSPPEHIRGKFIMNARIKYGSGDTNVENNKDSDTVIHSNVH